MTIISPANKAYIQNYTSQQENNKTMAINPALENDKFIKNNKRKKAVIAGIGILATGAAAFIFRKDISKIFKKLKNSISFTGKTEPKNVARYLDLSKPEKIKIPTNGYDLSKEATTIEFTTNNSYSGFSWMSKHLNRKTSFSAPVFETTPGIRFYNIGINQNGIAYVNLNPEDIGLDGYISYTNLKDISEQNKKVLSNITLLSKDSNFTPAQKNIIAIMHQKLGNSANSMFTEDNRVLYDYIDNGNYDNNETFEQMMQRISNWAKDIDTSNEETQKLLRGLSSLKRGEQIRISDLTTEEGIAIHVIK